MNDIEKKDNIFSYNASWGVDEQSDLVFITFENFICVTVDIVHSTIRIETKNGSPKELESYLEKNKEMLLFAAKSYWKEYNHGALVHC